MNHRSKHLTRRMTNLTLASALAWAATACGNVTVGGFTSVTVDVSGDASDPPVQPTVLAGSPAPAPSAASPPLAADGADEAEGEVEIDVTLALLSETGGVVSLGEDDIRIKLDLQGVEDVKAVQELVPTGHYDGFRITFTHIKVEVSGGLIINGQPVVGEIHVELEDPELVVMRPLDLEAVEDSPVMLLVDLNTRAWLEAVDPVALTVDAAVFAALVDLVVR